MKLKQFARNLKRSEGISIIPIIVVMVVMSVMGSVFTSIMGPFKLSGPITANSKQASYLADTAAMFSLHDAKIKFYGGSFNYGTRSTPYVVYSSSTEEANYWFERPDTGFANDDDITGVDDDVVDDDADDASNPTLYSIIATGKVKRGGATVATRQVKVLADIIRSAGTTVAPGVQTSGDISGTGGGFGMSHNALSTEFNVGMNNDNPPGSEAGIVIRPAQTMDENFVKALAIDQGHYNAVDLVVNNSNDDYPEPATPSFYYDSPTDIIPNFSYVGRDLTVNSRTAHGVIWVKRDVVLNGNSFINGIIICEGNVTFNGNADLFGGIIHYGGVVDGNGNPNAIVVNDAFFNALSLSIPIVTVQSWQEAVSAN